MPLFTHRFTTATSSSASTFASMSPSYNSKPSKTHKPNSSSFSSSYALSRIHIAVIVFSVFSAIIGIAGTICAITSGGGGGSVYRCGGSKDTCSRVSGSIKMGGDGVELWMKDGSFWVLLGSR
ncbi:unnamed protein product [Cochlearia groenlandica]